MYRGACYGRCRSPWTNSERRITDARQQPGTVALEAEIVRLRKRIDQHDRDLDVQLQRIGQLQADLDAIRGAWMKTKPAPKRRTPAD